MISLSGFLSLVNMGFLIAILVGLAYWYLLSIGSIKKIPSSAIQVTNLKFAVVIPARDEEYVIAATIQSILRADYPRELFDVYVVADHCTDQTAAIAQAAGAITYERQNSTYTDKGSALSWLFERILIPGHDYTAIVIFDADTLMHPKFFVEMYGTLASGAQVVQGRHVIRNDSDGWFPALTWAMFIIDNRYQNQGRVNLGLSAKNMGDSICIKSEILSNNWLGSGLTEDYAFRQKLLLHEIKISYNPHAIGYGEAPGSWHEARDQRARWLRGVFQASRATANNMLQEGFRKRNLAIFDGAIQAYLPAYSTLTLISVIITCLSWLGRSLLADWQPVVWLGILFMLFVYPFLGLALEKAPLKAYLVILTGPVFILWRTWLSLNSRYLRRNLKWVRTPRKIDHRPQ